MKSFVTSVGKWILGMSDRLFLSLLLLAYVVICGRYFHVYHSDFLMWMGDSVTYRNAAHVLASGHLDPFRTPPYPLFYLANLRLFGDYWQWSVPFIQMIVYGIAIIVFFKLCRRIMPKPFAMFCACLITFVPLMYVMIFTLYTDAFTISLSIFLMWSAYSLMQRPSVRQSILLFIWLFLMIATRPASLIFAIVIAMLGAYMIISRRVAASGWIMLGLVALTAIPCYIYSLQIEAKTGVFSPSIVTVINQFNTYQRTEETFPEYFGDRQDLARELDSIKRVQRTTQINFENSVYSTSLRYVNEWGADKMQEFNRQVKRNHPGFVAWLVIDRLMESTWLDEPFYVDASYLLILFCNVCIFIGLKRKRRLSLLAIYLLLVIDGNAAMLIWYSFNDWARLYLLGWPSLMMLTTWIAAEMYETRKARIKKSVKTAEIQN